METSAATDYIARNAQTAHDCPSVKTCKAPAWWQDHCSIYNIVAQHHKNWATQSNREAEVTHSASRALAKANPDLQLDQVERIVAPQIRALFRNPDSPSSLMELLQDRIPELNLPKSKDWKRGTRDEDRITRIQNAENHLIIYYHARVTEARRKISRTTFSLDSSERASLDSYAQEAFMAAIREYDIDMQVPIQPFLRRRIPDRLRDIIIATRPMGRPMRDYDISTSRHMEENPNVRSRVEAAMELGISEARIQNLETLHMLKSAQSLEWLLRPEDNSAPIGENTMLPVGAAGPVETMSEEAAAMKSIIEGFPEDDQLIVEAYIDGNAGDAAARLGISHAKVVSRARAIISQAKERYLLFRELEGCDFIKEGTALKSMSTQTVDEDEDQDEEPKEEPKGILEGLTGAERNELVRRYIKGGLTAWAEAQNVDAAMARRMAITLLEDGIRDRRRAQA